MSSTTSAEQFTLKHGVITNPGTFEGQPPWVPLCHDLFMEGWANGQIYDNYDYNFEDDYGDAFCAEINTIGEYLLLNQRDHMGNPLPSLHEDWDLYEDTYAVVLWYSEQGFITGEEFTEKDFQILCMEHNIE